MHRQEYYAIITHMDAQIGRILDALGRSGKAQSTYVFFSVRLYNVAEDPDEMKDLASDPGYRPVIRRLFAKLLELQKETGDELHLRAAFPEL